MHDELAAAGIDVTIFGVNSVGLESGNAQVCEDNDIGWLQPMMGDEVWTEWGITLRDLVILDEDNVVIAIYNLSVHDLQDPVNYDEAYGLFETAVTGN
ncbi:MAG: hypothetical protein HOV80_05610 [Polyangiaceae bacterium]|nr:hypothetical protein [Polyangiaceae bacterium]